MTIKKFLHKCAGMQVTDIIALAEGLKEAQSSKVINALISAKNEAENKAGFYVKGFKTVFSGETVEAFGDNNCGCYAAIEL